MAFLSRKILYGRLVNKIQQTRHRQLTMPGMMSFHTQIMEEYPELQVRKDNTFKDLVRLWAGTEGGRISKRHDSDGGEIFYLTVDICPIDSWKIKRLLCGLWHCKKHH